MAVGRGTAEVNFGTRPTWSERATVTVTGQTGLVAGAATQVEAWVRLEATADHTLDEIEINKPDPIAGEVTTGQFVIRARARNGVDHGTYLLDYIWST